MKARFLPFFALVLMASLQQPPPAPEGRFVDNRDGTVTDTWRRIMWARADSGKTMDWMAADAYCRDLKLAGHDDWRMPSGYELGVKLYDGLQPPGKWVADRRVTPFEWSGDWYWCWADGDAGHGRPGMFVRSFKEGTVGVNGIGEKVLVRACRSLPPPKGPRFKDNKDGTVTDQWEGLTWTKADSVRPLKLKDAERYCNDLDIGGRKRWRLPSFEELHDLLYVALETDNKGLGLDRRITPFEWSGREYWSSRIVVDSGEGGHGREVLDFVGGDHGWVSTGNLRLVRPCRDGR